MTQEKEIVKIGSYEEKLKLLNNQISEITSFHQSLPYLKQIKDNLWKATLRLNEKFSDSPKVEFLDSQVYVLFDACYILNEYLTQEFSKSPINAKYYIAYIINELDKLLQESFDYHAQEFSLEQLDENLEGDICFGLHNGEEIKKAGLTQDQVDQIAHSYSASSMWGGSFLQIIETCENLNRLYIDEFNFSFNSLPIEVGDKIFESKVNSKSNPFVDLRKSDKAPTNAARIKALKDLCPELWDKLTKCQSKEIQQAIIHAITEVNKEDSYKFSFGHRQSELDKVDVAGLTKLL